MDWIERRSETERLVKLETEQSHLERQIEQLRTDQKADFKWLIGALATFSTALAGLIAKSAGWI